MRKTIILALLGSAFSLSACINANSDLERAAAGGLIGCAAGQVLANGRCVEGAIIGAGAGVLTN